MIEARGELLRGFLERLSLVGEFPGDVWIVDLAEVTVVGGLRVDRAEEVELLHDVGWLEGEDLQHSVEDLVVADGAGAKAVDVDAHRKRVTDGVGELHFALRGEAGGDDVLGDPATHVGSAAIHFGRVFAGEGTTTVTAHAAVAIDDDFTAGEAAVTLRTANDELASRIDEILGVLGEHVLRQDFLDDLLDAELLDLGVAHVSGVLSGDDDVDDARGLAIDVFDGNLAFGVGTEPLGKLTSLADAGQLTAKAMRKHDRCRHQLGCFVTSIAKHDALVASALFTVLFAFGFRSVHTLSDVGALNGEVVVDEDLVGVEDVVHVGVTDATDGVANDLAHVDDFVDGLGGAELLVLELRNGDFTTDDDDIALHEGFAGDAAFEVDLEAGVKNGVGDGISNFVRMAFADGFGREDIRAGHGGGRLGLYGRIMI